MAVKTALPKKKGNPQSKVHEPPLDEQVFAVPCGPASVPNAASLGLFLKRLSALSTLKSTVLIGVPVAPWLIADWGVRLAGQ
jgi:hypothetical protein